MRPPTGLFFIPWVIYEHGEPWWNNIDKGKLLIRPLELSGNSIRVETSSTKLGVTGERNDEFGITKYLCSYFEDLTCCKILRHIACEFTSPLKESVLRNFIALKTPSVSSGFEPWCSGKHANLYTTENDINVITYLSLLNHLKLKLLQIILKMCHSSKKT
jgi:hypothetical protein